MTDNATNNNKGWTIENVKKNKKGGIDLTLSGLSQPLLITTDCVWKLVKKCSVKKWHQLVGKDIPHYTDDAREDLRSFLGT